jgi:DNA-binding protein YbaB
MLQLTRTREVDDIGTRHDPDPEIIFKESTHNKTEIQKNNMKLSAIILSLIASQVCAFSVSHLSSRTTTSSVTSLNLFGGGGEKKGPSVMDQLAMFKKAQDLMQKKKKLDEELQRESFEGVSSDGKVKVIIKYLPSGNPMDPNPDYPLTSFDFDDEFFESSEPSVIAESAKSAVFDGMEKINQAVAEKYKALQTDLMSAFGEQKQQ